MLILKKQRLNTIKDCLDKILDVRIDCDAQEQLYNTIARNVGAIYDEIKEAVDDDLISWIVEEIRCSLERELAEK
jgi:hypothetical protein